jgi:hypothetical protein
MIAWRRIGEEEEFAANPTAPKEELLEPPIAEQELDDNRDNSNDPVPRATPIVDTSSTNHDDTTQ